MFRVKCMLVALVIGVGSMAAAETDDAQLKSAFNQAYGSYSAAIDAGDRDVAFELALEALELGEQLFGDNDQNTAALTMNAALLYPKDHQWGSSAWPKFAAMPLMTKLVERYQAVHGADSLEMLEPLLLYAETLRNGVSGHNIDDGAGYTQSKSFSRRLADLEEVIVRISALAEIHRANFKYDRLMIRLSKLRSEKDEDSALKALRYREEALGAEHPSTLRARYFYANNFLKGKKRVQAFTDLVSHEVLPVDVRFAVLQQLTLVGPKAMRQDYAEALDELGQKLQVGKSVAGQDYLPIVKVPPDYPRSALSRGRIGWVILEFTVTENGSTANVRVVANCSVRKTRDLKGEDCVGQPSTIFDKAAIAAAKQFRYVPRFLNGYPIRTEGVQNKVSFDLL